MSAIETNLVGIHALVGCSKSLSTASNFRPEIPTAALYEIWQLPGAHSLPSRVQRSC